MRKQVPFRVRCHARIIDQLHTNSSCIYFLDFTTLNYTFKFNWIRQYVQYLTSYKSEILSLDISNLNMVA